LSDAALLARTTSEWPSIEALLDHLAHRPASSFALPHESPSETLTLLERHFPGYVPAIRAAADAVCRNELSLPGGSFRFPEGIDWQKDPVTGWRWPAIHRSRLGRYVGSERPVDLQVLWKLNRHPHFITLGIAYWLTGEDRYAETLCGQLQSWIDANPVQHGLNWHYGIDVALRLITWTVAFQFVRRSSAFRTGAGNAFLKSLYQQADFLSGHLQTRESPGDIPNNHLLAELTGLLVVGSAFPEFREAAAWRSAGLDLLQRQLAEQTHRDGVNKEQATGYHRFVAELLLLIVARSRLGVVPRLSELESTLERMLDYVMFATSPMGTAPMWGDCDYARALGLGHDKSFWDFRPLLAMGAALFERADWKFVARRLDEEAFWWLGPTGLSRWEALAARPPANSSKAFPESGLYVIRDGWSADGDVGVFRCGPFGLGGELHCAHAHCDLLALQLWVQGEPLLVDSGTYMYHGPWRDHFRLTAAHNTVKVGGCEQAVPLSHFNWQRLPQARCKAWTETRVTGVLAYPDGVEFQREVVHPRRGVWKVIDGFTGCDDRLLEWYFHFAPGLELQLDELDMTVKVIKNGRPFLLMHIPWQGLRAQLRDSWYSSQYGAKQSNRELYVRREGDGPGSAASFEWTFELLDHGPVPL
jgi:hypothetical protein